MIHFGQGIESTIDHLLHDALVGPHGALVALGGKIFNILGPKPRRPFSFESKMATITPESEVSEKVADLTNDDISAEEKPVEKETKEEGVLFD